MYWSPAADRAHPTLDVAGLAGRAIGNIVAILEGRRASHEEGAKNGCLSVARRAIEYLKMYSS